MGAGGSLLSGAGATAPGGARAIGPGSVTRSHPSIAAFRSRNFRLLWAGLLLSFTGSYMQNAALLWHVSLLAPPGRKALALGMVGLVKIVPVIAFSMLAGVAA